MVFRVASGSGGGGGITTLTANSTPTSGFTAGQLLMSDGTKLQAAGNSIITGVAGGSALTLTGATQTSSFPVLSATQTWNNAAVSFTANKINVTDTASNALSLLQDWQVGGTSKAGIIKNGEVYAPGGFSASATKSGQNAAQTGIQFASNISATLVADGLAYINWTNFSNAGRLITIQQNAAIGFSINSSVLSGSDTSLSRISSGIIGVGTTGVQGSIAGGMQMATLALGGATIGSNALAVTGTANISGNTTFGGRVITTNINNAADNAEIAFLPSQIAYFADKHTFTTSAGGITTTLSIPANNTLQIGLADASSAVAQTLQFQSSTGAATTGPTSTIVLAGGVSASGGLQIQKKVNGTPTTILDWGVTNGGWSFPAGSSSVPGVALGANGSTGIYSRSGAFFNITAGGTIVLDATSGAFGIPNVLQFAVGSSATGVTANTLTAAAGHLDLSNGATQQEFRVYQTTTGSKYKALAGDGNLVNVSGYAFTDGAAAALGTLTNAPAAGNPTKWIPINDNGTTRYIPAW